MYAMLISDIALDHNTGQRTRSFHSDVCNSRDDRYCIADHNWRVIAKTLFAVQHAGSFDLKFVKELVWGLIVQHLKAKQVSRGYRNSRVAAVVRRFLRAIDLIYLVLCLEEAAKPTRLDIRCYWREAPTYVRLIDQNSPSRLIMR